jgi:hypothetical protein
MIALSRRHHANVWTFLAGAAPIHLAPLDQLLLDVRRLLNSSVKSLPQG